jgi:hypothetical protein
MGGHISSPRSTQPAIDLRREDRDRRDLTRVMSVIRVEHTA